MRKWIGWTHSQETDRLELGERPAQCLKGENARGGQEIVAGRAFRAKQLEERVRRANNPGVDRGSWRPWWVERQKARL